MTKKTKPHPKPANSSALTGLYPGTFDPVTLGHTDLIWRATKVVSRLVVGVAENAGKGPLFTLKERVRMVEAEVAAMDTNGAEVIVRPFKNLLVEFAQEVGARVIVRGLRAVSDFEYEFQMAAMNRKLSPIETLFLMSSDKYQFISSGFVKEIARLGGDVGPFVSERVLKEIRRKIK
ncbi:MAG TPA: pantetheine-phosphate adenylyltransferase [Alphaproteobacteria bacterium]|nr:pantetheine-phosphate adenylyltransferase [Alphaproteobacteria bacterium]